MNDSVLQAGVGVDVENGTDRSQGGAAFNVVEFFQRFCSDPDAAMRMIGAQVPENGPASPRAKPYVLNGEWDEGRRVPIVQVVENSCSGKTERRGRHVVSLFTPRAAMAKK